MGLGVRACRTRKPGNCGAPVSIPDLVGLGVRGRVGQEGRFQVEQFQSPIWWGWGLEGMSALFTKMVNKGVSIPDLVGLGVRGE